MQRKIIFSLLLAVNIACLPAAQAQQLLSSQPQKASKKMAETNEQQAIPQSLWEILKNPEEWEMDIYSFPSNILTALPVDTGHLYEKGYGVSYTHISNRDIIKEYFEILKSIKFEKYEGPKIGTRFLIEFKHKQKDLKIRFLDMHNIDDFMIFQIDKTENGKYESFPVGITGQAEQLKKITKKLMNK